MVKVGPLVALRCLDYSKGLMNWSYVVLPMKKLDEELNVIGNYSNCEDVLQAQRVMQQSYWHSAFCGSFRS